MIASFVLVLCLTAPLEALERWGPFRGQIVDAETGQPIPDAAVLVVWWEADPTPVQTRQKFYDAREAVSGPDGRFEVPALTPPFFSFLIFDPKISYFAPGYVSQAVVVEPSDGQAFVASTVVQMRQLKTRTELFQKSRGFPSQIPLEKIPHFLKAINAERRMLGLRPEGE